MTETTTPGAAATIAAPETSPAELAFRELETLRADPAHMDRYLAGDATSVHRMMAAIDKVGLAQTGQQQPAAQPAPPAKSGAETLAPAPAQEPAPVINYAFQAPAEMAPENLRAIGAAMSAAGLEPELGRAVFSRGLELWRLNGSRELSDTDARLMQQDHAAAQLVERHGQAGARELIARAREAVKAAAAKNPNVIHWIEALGLGSDPWTIELLARTYNRKGT